MGALELSDARPTIETNWALAHVSFPMIVKMMLLDNDRYHDAIVSGLRSASADSRRRSSRARHRRFSP